MPSRVFEPSDDVTVYLVLNDHGQFGIAYDETDPARADRETIIRNFLSGQYSNALRVVAFNTAEGWSRDVSEDIAGEVLERAFDADDNRGEDAKRFIDRHMTPGEKRPPAPSVRLESVQGSREAGLSIRNFRHHGFDLSSAPLSRVIVGTSCAIHPSQELVCHHPMKL